MQAGDLMLTIEAMKMETGLYADKAGTVKALHVQPGRAGRRQGPAGRARGRLIPLAAVARKLDLRTGRPVWTAYRAPRVPVEPLARAISRSRCWWWGWASRGDGRRGADRGRASGGGDRPARCRSGARRRRAPRWCSSRSTSRWRSSCRGSGVRRPSGRGGGRGWRWRTSRAGSRSSGSLRDGAAAVALSRGRRARGGGAARRGGAPAPGGNRGDLARAGGAAATNTGSTARRRSRGWGISHSIRAS